MKNSQLKQDIKLLAQEQMGLKPQRKTTKFLGARTLDAYKAVQASNQNKEKLRHLYVAYNILRGKEVVPFKKREFQQSLVDKYVEKYRDDFTSETE